MGSGGAKKNRLLLIPRLSSAGRMRRWNWTPGLCRESLSRAFRRLFCITLEDLVGSGVSEIP